MLLGAVWGDTDSLSSLSTPPPLSPLHDANTHMPTQASEQSEQTDGAVQDRINMCTSRRALHGTSGGTCEHNILKGL